MRYVLVASPLRNLRACMRSALYGDHTQYLSSCVLIRSTAEQAFVPTVFQSYVADIDIDGKNVALALWDMPLGHNEYADRLHPLSYPGSHVILICFAIDSPDSLDNIEEKVRTVYSA